MASSTLFGYRDHECQAQYSYRGAPRWWIQLDQVFVIILSNFIPHQEVLVEAGWRKGAPGALLDRV